MSELYTLPDGWEWKNISDVILVNRNDNILDDVKDKIYTRDLFSRD